MGAHVKPRQLAALSLSCLLSFAAVGHAQPRTAGSPETLGSPSTAIRRQTTAGTSNFGAIPTEREVPRGEVGGTGEVISRGPQTQLRGGTQPPPDAIDMSRPIGPGDVARIVRSKDAQFRACYEQGRARVRALQGRVNMRFMVRRDGSLDGIDVSGLPAAPEVATCIREHLAALRLPRPQAGAFAFNTGMNFSPPAPPPPRARSRRAPRR